MEVSRGKRCTKTAFYNSFLFHKLKNLLNNAIRHGTFQSSRF